MYVLLAASYVGYVQNTHDFLVWKSVECPRHVRVRNQETFWEDSASGEPDCGGEDGEEDGSGEGEGDRLLLKEDAPLGRLDEGAFLVLAIGAICRVVGGYLVSVAIRVEWGRG